MEIGERVGAILSANENSVQLFGYGIYEGDKIPEKGPLAEAGLANPCILLDNGKRVYGYECWWGPEEKVKQIIGNRRIEIV